MDGDPEDNQPSLNVPSKLGCIRKGKVSSVRRLFPDIRRKGLILKLRVLSRRKKTFPRLWTTDLNVSSHWASKRGFPHIFVPFLSGLRSNLPCECHGPKYACICIHFLAFLNIISIMFYFFQVQLPFTTTSRLASHSLGSTTTQY